MTSNSAEMLKTAGDHIAGATAGTSVVLWLAQIAQAVSAVAGMLAISWYVYRYYDKLFIVPRKEIETRIFYISALAERLKMPREEFSSMPTEVLRHHYEVLSGGDGKIKSDRDEGDYL